MAVVYYQRSDASDLTGPSGSGGTSRSLVASRTAGGASADLATGNMNSGVNCNQNFFTPSADPGTDGTSTGSFTVLVRCTAASAGGTVGIQVFLRRATGGDTGGTEVEASEGSQTAVASTTRTFTWTDPGLGAWAAGDRLRIRVQLTNTSGTMNQSATIAVDTSSDTIDTPFTAAAPPTGGTMRRWTGTAFAPGGTLKRWTGTAFATGGTLRRWTGSSWEPPP